MVQIIFVNIFKD